MAGESADDVARRMRERADRLAKAADKWERGASGERQVAAALADGLPTEWSIVHDVRWPGRPRANIDHVVLGPPGVFVIDTKHWDGEVLVRDGVLRQNGWRREREVARAKEAALAIANVLVARSTVPVFATMCLVRSGFVPLTVDGVMVCGVDRVAEWMQTGRSMLSAGDRESLRAQLVALPSAGG